MEFTLFCKSWIWVGFSLLMHRQDINSCLSCSICFFATSFFSILQFLGKLLLGFLGRVYSSFPILHTSLFLSLWAWSAHWFACCSCTSLGFELLIDLKQRAISEFLFPNVWPPRLPQLRIIFAEPIFLLARPIHLSVQGFYGDVACLSTFTQRFGLDLSSPLTQTRKDLKQLFHDPCPHKSPWCWSDLQHNRNPPTVSWG